jgi:hypothetical protein
MKRLLFIAILLAGLLQSCDPDNPGPCSESREAAALVTDFPDSLKVGIPHMMQIKYVLESSCGTFDYFDISQMDNSITVKLMTKYEGCNCDLQFTEHTTEFEIVIDFPGVYEYQFWQADGDYDSKTITIYE